MGLRKECQAILTGVSSAASLTVRLRRAIGGFYIGFALWALLLPGLRIVSILGDKGISSGKIPTVAWSLHRSLAPRYEDWAKRWSEEESSQKVQMRDVAGTEWPLFG